MAARIVIGVMTLTLTPAQISRLRRMPPAASGNRLQAAIDLAKGTQTEVARQTGFTFSYIADCCRGRYQTLTVTNAHRIAAVFGCLVDDLFPARDTVGAR